MTQTSAPTGDAAAARSGLHAEEFATRRTLVFRRFLRNWPAVVSLALLVIMFVACYALPSVLPYSYSDLDYYALQEPPSTDHWFGTNALGQDIFAQTLRGMQKSMLICLCVAFISTCIAATVGSGGAFTERQNRRKHIAQWIPLFTKQFTVMRKR